jgi:protein SCO1/2
VPGRWLLAGLVALITGASGGQALGLDRDAAMAASRAAIGRAVTDARFVSSSGEEVRLADFRGKPTLISLIFTSCYHICPTQTSALHSATRAAADLLGRDRITVLTIGFDTVNDTPRRMAEYAEERGIDERDWRFLAADAVTIERLARELGFSYEPTAGGFDHMLQTTILDSGGRVAYQVYGGSFGPPALIEPLRDLLIGERLTLDGISLGGWVDGLKLFCTVYDPASGRYRFDYSLIVAIGVGVLCLGGVGYVLVGLWRAPTA